MHERNSLTRVTKAWLCVAVVAATFTAVAAALGASSAKGTSLTTLKIKADQIKLRYDKKTLTAPAGKITIVMTNPSIRPHNVAIRASTRASSRELAKGRVVTTGGTSTITVTIFRKGMYRFYCSFDGHEASGMWGTLKVT